MIFDDLLQRGLVKQTTNAEKIRNLLDNDKISFYIGFDPTADSLHVGHLLQLVTAKRLVKAGHRFVALIGGATALVGDPSGKSELRKMLSNSEIAGRHGKFTKQIQHIMETKVSFADNIQWFQEINFLEFIRDIGQHFSVNNMLRSECFKSRSETGLSFLEFSYMLMQAFDFLTLNRIDEKNVLQVGGDDQWSNMLAGTDLIRRKTGRETFALTLPLLVNSDGTKMGKTEKGAIWLDPEKTSPFEFFQFWRNIPDDQVEKCFLFFTDWTLEQINVPFESINERKKQLAREITKIVHGDKLAWAALKQAEALFESQDFTSILTIEIENGAHILDLLVRVGFAKSRTDARNLINGRGIAINDQILDNPTLLVTRAEFGDELVVRKGKKNFRRFVLKDEHETT